MKITIHKLELEVAPVWKRLLSTLIDIIILVGLLLIPVANFALVPVYFFGKDSLTWLRGQSIGKKIIGIRVMNLNSKYDLMNDFQAGINRNLTHLLLIDIFIPLFKKNNQRLGDDFAKTVVVNDSQLLRVYNKQVERDYQKYIILSDSYDLREYKPHDKVENKGKHPIESYKVRRDWKKRYNQDRNPLRNYRKK